MFFVFNCFTFFFFESSVKIQEDIGQYIFETIKCMERF